jgi:hypothetical protein
MEQILKKSKISLPEVEIRELVPDRNRKAAAPVRLLSPEPTTVEPGGRQQRYKREDQGSDFNAPLDVI